jgi:hypothetical protein
MHEAFVQYMGSQMRPNVYLELGVGEGDTFNLIAPFVSRAIAVDTKMPECLEDFETYEMKTEEFFNDGWLKGTADLIFIDADQSYAGVKSDLMNSLKVLSEDGMIIMNNTDPISEKNMTAEGHKLVDEIEEGKIPHMNVTTLPIGDGGLSIITNKKCSRTQQRASSPDKVDKDGKLKPKFYVPEAYNLSEYAEMKANSPYKQY